MTFSLAAGDTGSFSTTTCTLPGTGTNQCSVTYTASGKGDGAHGITATYGGDSTYLTSYATTSVSVALRRTTTTVACTPSIVVPTNTTMTCTATVKDTEPAGTKLNPLGTVTFTRDGGYTQTCSLTATPLTTDTSTCSVTFTSTSAIVWVVAATYGGSNQHAGSSADTFPVVFYDPSGGFVTGGGYIKHEDPVGAANPNAPGIAGKDNFGFNAKYLKNASVPTGETEFQCKVCNLNFRSTSYDWLVIARLSPSTVKAQYQGTGTVNGVAGYGFLVTVIDGGQTDTARIRIWNKTGGAVLYDNEFGTATTTDPTTVTAGGNIVVHEK